jgi:hypothetical protein
MQELYRKSEQRPVLLAIQAMICLAIAGPALAAGNTFDGVYTGKRLLTKGPSLCLREDPVSITINERTMSVTNSELKDFAIGFDPRPDGSFEKTYDDLGGNALIKGRITKGSIDADVTNYATSCTHHWHLTKQR